MVCHIILPAVGTRLMCKESMHASIAARSHLLLFASVYASAQATAKEKLRLVSVVIQGVEILGRVVPRLPVKVELELL